MKVLLLVTVIMAFGLQEAHGNMWDVRRFIRNVTGNYAMSTYAFYGCHCSLKRRGKPTDDIDRCCFAHTCCYSTVEQHGCRPEDRKYNIKVKGKTVLCGSNNKNKCKDQFCDCDKTFAYCLETHKKSYNKNYQYHHKKCLGDRPKCLPSMDPKTSAS